MLMARDKGNEIAIWVLIFLVTAGWMMIALPWTAAFGEERQGSIIISVRDSETGYALPAFISISQVMEDGSTGSEVCSFRMPRSGAAVKTLSPGKYRTRIEAQGYIPMDGSLFVVANKELHFRFMLHSVKSKEGNFNAARTRSGDMAVVSGYVTDDQTGYPLEGVHVVFRKKEVDTYTDRNGYFQVYVPIEGKIAVKNEDLPGYQETIVFSLEGYKTRKEINKLIVPNEHLKMPVVMFRGKGEIIYDRTHKLLLPPEKIEEIEKQKREIEKKIKTNYVSPPSESFAAKSSFMQGNLVVMRPPETITVGFDKTMHECCLGNCTKFREYALEDYVLKGVCNEWYPSWANYPHSIRAGTVAYRSYAAWYYHSSWYKKHGYICSSGCCQAFDEDQEISLMKTAGIMLQKNGSVFKSEYSAQNNCLQSPNNDYNCKIKKSPCCRNDDLSCGDCYVGSPKNGWPCLYDPVGCGKYCDGHGRGMSQFGSYHWAKDYGKTWPWIVNHYYNDNGNPAGERSAYMTSPIEITNASPSRGSVSPGGSFQINITAEDYAGPIDKDKHIPNHKHIIIGASLYSSNTGYISDSANDKAVVLYKGSNNISRNFHVPTDTPSGTYDLYVALWLDVDENNQITVEDLPLNSKVISQSITIIGTSPHQYFTINLNRSFNLISLPVQSSDNSIESVLASISGKYLAVVKYSNGHWDWYSPEYNFFNFTTMEPGTGYFIYMTEPGTLTIKGEPISDKSIYLKSGDWNLVGFNSQQSMPPSIAFNSIKDKIGFVFKYVNGNFEWYSPTLSDSNNTLKQMKPGYGYFIYVDEDCTWVAP